MDNLLALLAALGVGALFMFFKGKKTDAQVLDIAKMVAAKRASELAKKQFDKEKETYENTKNRFLDRANATPDDDGGPTKPAS